MSVFTDLCRLPLCTCWVKKPRHGRRVHYLDNWLPLQCNGTVLYHQHQVVCLVVTKCTCVGAGRRQPGLVFRPQTDGRTYAVAGCGTGCGRGRGVWASDWSVRRGGESKCQGRQKMLASLLGFFVSLTIIRCRRNS